MNYYKPSTQISETNKLRERAVLGGYYCGYDALHEIFQAKPGYPLFVAGAPHSGKTEFIMQLLINWSKAYGWRHFVYFGESGTGAEIIAELAHKYIGKPYRKMKLVNGKVIEDPFAMSEAERVTAEAFIDEHFVILDLESEKATKHSLTLDEFYQEKRAAQDELGVTFNTSVADPYNDFDMDLSTHGGREDLFLKDVLRNVRIESKRTNCIDILINHVASLPPQKIEEKWFSPPAMPNQWAGGQTWHRRAFTMLLVYRPPEGLESPVTGLKYTENQTQIINQKAKPKGSGKLGVADLFYDWKSGGFYEKKYNKDLQAFEAEKETTRIKSKAIPAALLEPEKLTQSETLAAEPPF